MLDLENPKSRNLFLYYIWIKGKISAKLVKKCLKTGFFWISRKYGSKIQNSFLLKTFPWPTQNKIGPAVLESTNKHTDRQTSYYFVVLILRKNIWPTYISKISMKPQSRSVQPFRSNCQKYDNMKLCPEYSRSIHLLIFAIKYQI